MKRLLSFLLLVSFAGAIRSTAQIASFSFGGPDSAPGWTNMSGDPAIGVQTATAGGITLSSVAPANWVPDNAGHSALDYNWDNTNGYFPAAVMGNAWKQWNGNNGFLAVYNAAIPQIELTGLNPDSTYILRMSGGEPWYAGITQYTVAGVTLYGSQQLNTYQNNNQGVTFANVKPDASGMIRLYVNPISEGSYAWISGLQIFSGSSANIGIPTVSLTAPANGTTQSEGGNFIIAATVSDSGGVISKVEFFADTTKIGEADAAPYMMTWVDPDPGTYQITAKATDAIGNIATASANVAVRSLNYFWSTTGNIATNGDTNFIGTVDTNRLSFRTNNVERMSITKQGTIMVGGVVPDSGNCKLKVIGTMWTAGLKMPTGAQSGYVLTSDTAGNASWQPGGGGRWQFVNGTVYDSADNVAIGTTNTQGYKLAVNGAGIFTKIVAKPQVSWPDYVFDKGYKLLSLEELAQYLREHHHLPDVTPESEIAHNGIDLGQQQTTLLKKVEELTLYLIRENQSLTEQNNQLKDQNARLEAQQKEIDELKAMIQANHKQ
jgi:hypothetical protein